MAADEVKWLDRKDLDAVLARAKAEGWTELALVGERRLAMDHADQLVRHGWRPAQIFIVHELHEVPLELTGLAGLRSLDLWGNRIGYAGAEAIARLIGLSSLDLVGNQIGNIGAQTIAKLTGLSSLNLEFNGINDAGAEAISRIKGLSSLNLAGNQIGDVGAEAIAKLKGLSSLNLNFNRISDTGAHAIAKLQGLSSLNLAGNQISKSGAQVILDAWADPETSDRRLHLGLRGNDKFAGFLPEAMLRDSNAQVIIAAWQQRKAQEAERAPLPAPEAAGEPVPHGVQVRVAVDGRLTLVDPSSGAGARDDAIGRELHGEMIVALDRLIAVAGRSNVVAEWREVAEGVKERLGGGPGEARVSAILRIERLRSLREADERRRMEPDPLIEPAEAGVAAALRDAVAAANLYVETDPYLAEQQRRLADPGLDLTISTEEAAAAEAEMDDLKLADPALLAELRLGRETAVAGGRAGERALAWLAGSWRNVVREMLRQVLAWVREQVKAARASADEAAMQAKLGAVITIEEGRAVLASMGLHGKNAASATARAGASWLRTAGHAAATGAGIMVGSVAVVGMVAFLEQQVALLTRLGWSPEFAAQIAHLLKGFGG